MCSWYHLGVVLLPVVDNQFCCPRGRGFQYYCVLTKKWTVVRTAVKIRRLFWNVLNYRERSQIQNSALKNNWGAEYNMKSSRGQNLAKIFKIHAAIMIVNILKRLIIILFTVILLSSSDHPVIILLALTIMIISGLPKVHHPAWLPRGIGPLTNFLHFYNFTSQLPPTLKHYFSFAIFQYFFIVSFCISYNLTSHDKIVLPLLGLRTKSTNHQRCHLKIVSRDAEMLGLITIFLLLIIIVIFNVIIIIKNISVWVHDVCSFDCWISSLSPQSTAPSSPSWSPTPRWSSRSPQSAKRTKSFNGVWVQDGCWHCGNFLEPALCRALCMLHWTQLQND